ncbi:MAG TPA: glycoside hydrolase family 3 N-terminal domain-containing protein [Terriglobales bacterium]|nr:glycoside hydrolase family 3 N-terminal domain-containing protein [Terriglobales bacterium]
MVNSHVRSSLVILFCLILLPRAWSQTWANDPKTEARIDSILKQMTLEEKIGQLNQYSVGEATGPGGSKENYADMVAKGEVGSLYNVPNGEKINEFQKIAVEKSRLHVPLIFGLDVIHGYRTTFPVPLALSATWDPKIVEKSARVAAIEASAAGVRWTFSPMVDIARDARWGRITEGAGEDPYLGEAMARAYVRGYQGTSLSNPDSIAACLKHFVGYGAAEGGREYNSTEIPERLLRQVYLPPFHAGLEQGAVTLMSAFNSLNGVPASANPFTLGQVLRKEWQFRGFVVSDWTSVAELQNHGIANDGPTAARKAFTAGVDMDMESNLYWTTLAPQFKSGAIPMARLDEAVRGILRVKFALGLFDHPYADLSRAGTVMLAPDHLAASKQAAEESFVLLKNDSVSGSPLLPLKADAKVALIGPLADSAKDMLGSWSTEGKADDALTLRKTLTERLGDKLIYAKGTDIRTDSEAGFAEATTAAKEADVVIVALGEDAAWMTGEAGSRAHLGLPGNQEKLLETIAATGKPVVLLVFSGRPLVLDWAASHVAAIMECWFPGLQAGAALAETLYGQNNPSGHLTTSFPRAVGQEPLYYNQLPTGRPPKDVDLTQPPTAGTEKYVSRYVDEQNTALYPFGFGLSYTTFTYSPVTLSSSTVRAADLNAGKPGLTVTAEVRNTGSVAGTEVVQLYINQRGTSVSRPIRELKGFERVTLQPGESKRVQFTLGRDELAFWNIDMKDVVEPASVKVWVAGSSTEGQPVQFAVE